MVFEIAHPLVSPLSSLGVSLVASPPITKSLSEVTYQQIS
jgi:hypothetical protein